MRVMNSNVVKTDVMETNGNDGIIISFLFQLLNVKKIGTETNRELFEKKYLCCIYFYSNISLSLLMP